MLSSDSFSSLSGKVAVITGGSRGIGKATADALIQHGASVVIGDILDEQGQAVVDEYNKNAGKKVAAFIHTDVTKYSDNQALFKLAESEFGGVDLVLLNAGVGDAPYSVFFPMDDDRDKRVIDINVTGIIKGTKVAILHLAKRGGGAIVNLASMAGFITFPELAGYNASKHAVIGYTRSLSIMPQVCNVRVNAICPYWVDTDMTRGIGERFNQSRYLSEYIEKSPHTRIETVVEGILTCFTDDSKSGQTILAKPDGLQALEPPIPLDSHFSDLSVSIPAEDYLAASIPAAKAQLAKALEAYGI